MQQVQELELKEKGMDEGRYLYCVVKNSSRMDLGKIGIENNEVHTIPFNNIGAVVHDCKAEPYVSKNDEEAKKWVLAHQYVIDVCTKKFGTVIPFTFDVIVKGNDGNVTGWLEKQHQNLEKMLNHFKGKYQYTIQVFCDSDFFRKKLEEKDEEIKKLEEKASKGGKGIAYMLSQKKEKLIREKLEIDFAKLSSKFYDEIAKHVNEIKTEKTREKAILSISCLLEKEKLDGLGDFLEKINNKEGISVRFTGPWAPFSFVGVLE